MSYNGEIAIDLDSHIVERADRFYQDYIDLAYRPPYQPFCDAVALDAMMDTVRARRSRNDAPGP